MHCAAQFVRTTNNSLLLHLWSESYRSYESYDSYKTSTAQITAPTDLITATNKQAPSLGTQGLFVRAAVYNPAKTGLRRNRLDCPTFPRCTLGLLHKHAHPARSKCYFFFCPFFFFAQTGSLPVPVNARPWPRLNFNLFGVRAPCQCELHVGCRIEWEARSTEEMLNRCATNPEVKIIRFEKLT